MNQNFAAVVHVKNFLPH